MSPRTSFGSLYTTLLPICCTTLLSYYNSFWSPQFLLTMVTPFLVLIFNAELWAVSTPRHFPDTRYTPHMNRYCLYSPTKKSTLWCFVTFMFKPWTYQLPDWRTPIFLIVVVVVFNSIRDAAFHILSAVSLRTTKPTHKDALLRCSASTDKWRRPHSVT